MSIRRFLALALLSTGCASAPKIYLPDSPEANSCARECMSIYNICRGGHRSYMMNQYGAYPVSNRRRCTSEESRCRSTCPGAKTGDELDAEARASSGR